MREGTIGFGTLRTHCKPCVPWASPLVPTYEQHSTLIVSKATHKLLFRLMYLSTKAKSLSIVLYVLPRPSLGNWNLTRFFTALPFLGALRGLDES